MKRHRMLLLGAVVAAAATPVIAGQASLAAMPARAIDWFAPGDSYTSGHGTAGADGDPKCRRSADSWVFKARDLLKPPLQLKQGSPALVACTGNTTDQFDSQWDLQRHDLLTFSFGGDDVNFAGVLALCVAGDATQVISPLFWLHTSVSNCPADDAVRADIARFDSTYRAFLTHVVRDATTAGGNVVVVGYPDIFANPARWLGVSNLTNVCNGLTDTDVKLVRGWAATLNATIGQAVSDIDLLRINNVRVTFVNVDDTATNNLDVQYLFEPSDETQVHTLCGNGESWMNGLTVGLQYTRAFHPNVAGHQAEGQLVAHAIQALDWGNLDRRAASIDASCPTDTLRSLGVFSGAAVAGASKVSLDLITVACSGGWAIATWQNIGQPAVMQEWIIHLTDNSYRVTASAAQTPRGVLVCFGMDAATVGVLGGAFQGSSNECDNNSRAAVLSHPCTNQTDYWVPRILAKRDPALQTVNNAVPVDGADTALVGMCHDQTLIGYAVGLYSLDATGDSPNYTVSTWYPDMTTVCRDDAKDFYVCGTAIPIDIASTPCDTNFDGKFGVDSNGAKFVCVPNVGWTAN